MNNTISTALGGLHKDEITTEEAKTIIEQNCSTQELAKFIVNAFNRGWITKFNLGLDDDGNVI